MPDLDALTSESFDFEKLFTVPNAEPLPSDAPNDDRTDAAMAARLRSYQQADDLNWLLDGARMPADSIKEPSAPRESEDAASGLRGLAGAAAMDAGMGAVEGPRQVVGGMRDATQSIIDLGEVADEWKSLGGITFTDEQGNFSLDYKNADEWRALVEGNQVTEPDLPAIDAARTVTGSGIRAITQFMWSRRD